MGAPRDAVSEIATAWVAGLASQAPVSVASESSTRAKSAASALSVTCTRTVASAGSSVKATWRSARQGRSAISTEALAMAMQGCGPGRSRPRANNAAATRGTAEARILKRNMEPPAHSSPDTTRAYGLRSVNKTGYRGVDGNCVWQRARYSVSHVKQRTLRHSGARLGANYDVQLHIGESMVPHRYLEKWIPGSMLRIVPE